MKCSNVIVPGFEHTNKIKNPGLEMKMEKDFDLSASRKTQIPATITTYRKVAEKHFSDVPPNEVLDFGAGLGVGTREFGFDSYEPFPQRGKEKYGWTPNYTDPSQINKEYKGLISNAVLNVIPNVNGERDAAVRAIGKSLAPGGKAFVAARGKAFLKDLKNPEPYGDGVITSSGTFQKGFTRAELRDYIAGILGPEFVVTPAKLGDMSVLITRKKIKNPFKDTGVYYHGTSTTPNITGDWSTSDTNIYGSGLYTTTNPSVARSYIKKGKGGSPNVYRIEENNIGPSLDLENTPAKPYARRLLGEYIDLDGLSLREALDEFRSVSADEGLSRGEVIDIMDTLFDKIERDGYTSVTHHGGVLTKSKTKHLVKIFLRPSRDIKFTLVE